MVAAGTLQFAIAQIQLPILPGSGKITALIHSAPGIASLRAAMPDFHPEVPQIAIVDRASIGLVHLALILGGLIACLRTTVKGASGSFPLNEKPSRSASPSSPPHPQRQSLALSVWPWLAAFAFGVLVSTSQIVPTTIGRSFLGFFALILPLAAIGLATWRGRLARSPQQTTPPTSALPLPTHWPSPSTVPHLACTLAILTGLTTLILNPAAPLWPAKSLHAHLESRGPSNLATTLETYLAYQKRAQTGTTILASVPHGEPVAVLARRITPVSTLWQPDWRARHIHFVNPIPPDQFAADPTARWLVVADNAAEFLPEATAQYQSLPGWEKIHQATYLPTLTQGPETWTLYHKID